MDTAEERNAHGSDGEIGGGEKFVDAGSEPSTKGTEDNSKLWSDRVMESYLRWATQR